MADELPRDAVKDLTTLDLASISPENVSSTSLLHGVITIKWPYSSSTQKLTFLLADPDPRKRAAGGQVKITLLGKAAEAIDKIESGEEISLAAADDTGGISVDNEVGGRIKYHVTFSQGCILISKDQVPRKYAPPTPPKPIVTAPLPRVPTPPPPTPPVEQSSSQVGKWNTNLKRKFGELTDHSMTTSLTDEEEWFGSEPRGGSTETSRRFSGRMRFIGPDGSTTASPIPKRLADENSFDSLKPTSPRRTGDVSPAQVLRAQNLVSAEILSEKLLHPSGRVDAGLDELSHAAVKEGSVRPMSAGMGSISGRKSVEERSFDVFQDDDAVDLAADVLPPELTRPSQVGQWSIPAVSVSESERPSPSIQLEQPDESESEDDKLTDVIRPSQPRMQLIGERQTSSPEQSEEEEEDGDLDAYDASGQLIQPTQRRYYQAEQVDSSEDESLASDDIDYEHPETYADDEELSGEEYEEDEDAQLARHYSRERRPDDEVFYHSDEEAMYSEDAEDVSEDESFKAKSPIRVDLTLDSSEDDQSDEDELEEEYDELEDEEEELEEEASWDGIKSTTPVTQFSDMSRQHSRHSPQLQQNLDFLLDPSLMAPLPHAINESEHPNPFTLNPHAEAAQLHAEMPSFPTDLLEQALDPAIFQQSHHASLQDLAEQSTALMDAVLSMPTDIPMMESQIMADQLTVQPQNVQQEQSFTLSEIWADAFASRQVENVDNAAEQEFLTGILPMGAQERGVEETEDEQRKNTNEFLPNIVPGVQIEEPQETLVSREEKKVRTEAQVSVETPIHDETVEPMDEIITVETEKRTLEVTQDESMANIQDPLKDVDSTTVDLNEQKTGSEGISMRSEVEQSIQREVISLSETRPQEAPSASKPQSPISEPQHTPASPKYIPHSPQRPRSPSPPHLPDDWLVEGLTTPLAYFPPLAGILPPTPREQRANRPVDLIGIIRETGELGKTKGIDYVLPLHIVDPSTGPDTGLSVLLFRPNKSALPENPQKGSVIVLTDMKVQSYQHRGQARTTESSGWILFSPEGEVQDSGPPVEYGEQEKLMVKQLQHWWKRSLEKGKGKGVVSNGVEENKDNVNGHVNGNGKGVGVNIPKNIARRGGKKANINRKA